MFCLSCLDEHNEDDRWENVLTLESALTTHTGYDIGTAFGAQRWKRLQLDGTVTCKNYSQIRLFSKVAKILGDAMSYDAQ